ncbi:hypothetical protein DW322_14325 [Rhodococcus rhodnii]|uniref:Uncharacterized protein n=1 Tax=Rhodococcus rhodnii TaxID=38312 RepID=A0A6P2CLJ6_9NOCA|nr:hypothetical protein DW322_14325 [Rhodococcus rhodnii]
MVLALLTVVAAGLFLTALAGGFAGWAWIAGPVALVLAVLTLLVMRDARRRRNDPIVYTPDNERP